MGIRLPFRQRRVQGLGVSFQGSGTKCLGFKGFRFN